MAVQSFYVSVSLNEEEKKAVYKIVGKHMKTERKTNDLVFKNILFIENGNWWHIGVGFYNLFAGIEALFDLCCAINETKPNFTFSLLGKELVFSYETKIDFITSLYPHIEKHKEHFEKVYGVLAVPPQCYFKFRRKTLKFWTK